MANLILTTDGWQDRVRLKLGVDEAYLSDTELAMPEIVSIAEANIIEQVPDYASKTGTNKVYLEAATVCECAILACPSMPARMPTREQGPHATFEISVDWDKKKAEFAIERDRYVGKILTGSFPTLLHFGISNPIREWEW